MGDLTIDGVWRETAAKVRANRGLFATLAAAFTFLPALLFALLVPQPVPGAQPPPGFVPFALLLALLQTVGSLAVISIAHDPKAQGRPVGATLATMVGASLRYVGTIFLVSIGLAIVAAALAIPLGLLTGAGTQPVRLALLLFLLALPLMVFVFAQLLPLAGVLAVERAGFGSALARAWRLGRGVRGRLVLFALLIFLVVVVVVLSVQGVGAAIGVAAAAAGGGSVVGMLFTAISIGVQSFVAIYTSVAVGTIWRRLAE